jgi:hypothetical protein
VTKKIKATAKDGGAGGQQQLGLMVSSMSCTKPFTASFTSFFQGPDFILYEILKPLKPFLKWRYSVS